jgi:DNA-binding NarL/FixJ family response regulator
MATMTNPGARTTPDSAEQTGLPRPNLTVREIEVLVSWFRCDSKPAVAAHLFLSLGTVNTHLTRIRQKYAAIGRPAPTKASLVARALQDGLVDIDEL